MKTEQWRGIFKLTEECGEVLQLLGKIGPFPDGAHPDGKGDLAPRISDEVADLYAALDYFVEKNSLDTNAIQDRRAAKKSKFDEWGLTGIPNV